MFCDPGPGRAFAVQESAQLELNLKLFFNQFAV
jgi:hypothetical protein